MDHGPTIHVLDSLQRVEQMCISSVQFGDESIADSILTDINLLQSKYKGVMDSSSAVAWQRYANLRISWMSLRAEADSLEHANLKWSEDLSELSSVLNKAATHDSLGHVINSPYISEEMKKLEGQQRLLCENAVMLMDRINQQKLTFHEMRPTLRTFLIQKRVLKK